jgi:hypothetical protein
MRVKMMKKKMIMVAGFALLVVVEAFCTDRRGSSYPRLFKERYYE